MRVFDFDHAIVRQAGRSVINGLRSDPATVPDCERILGEHSAYVTALREAGLSVDVLSPLEEFPDSIFVEDPALVLPEVAILLRPGAISRTGEADTLRLPLERHFGRVIELADNGFVDGGDVLVTPDCIFIGLSARTDRKGAEALAARLGQFGRRACIAATPASILHFKTAVSLLSEDVLLATRGMAGTGFFGKFEVICVPQGEEAAANALRINDRVFVGRCFPRTCELLAKAGFAIRDLDVSEIGKLDAGLSCMSLRWRKTDPAA